MGDIMSNKGMTIVELIIVLAIVSIIAFFTITNVASAQERARIKADTNTVVVLNQQTQDYSFFNTIANDDIFYGVDTDTERIDLLVSEGFITHEPEPAQKDAIFTWNVDEQYWSIEGGNLSSVSSSGTASYDFGVDFKETLSEAGVIFRNSNNWYDEDGYLENKSGEQRLFVPIGSTSYTISVSAALSSGTNGGYGIYFDTTLIDGNENKDSGFILQFDRGYAKGTLLVRPRSSGSEGSAVWQLRGSSSDLIPSTTEDLDWWSATHVVKITVTSTSGNNRSATFYIDGVEMGTYNYTKEITEEILYTGFRTWSNPTTKFYSLNVN